MKITIKEILKGCVPGEMQSAGYMQIIPLICDPELIDNRFGSFNEMETSTMDYGTLVVRNKTDKLGIMPMGSGIMAKQAAQNHATGKAVFIGSKQRTMMSDAACIQETQGGYIRPGQHEMTILPYAVRGEALNIKDTRSYSKLWPAITNFNRTLGVRSIGHLEHYLDEFQDNLDEFIGQFEIVKNQIGAIIILNGQIAGIEKAPNYEYWKELWKPLIRECYGSASLVFGKRGVKKSPPIGRMPINSVDVTDLDSLEAEFEKAQDFESEAVKTLIRDFIAKPFKLNRQQNQPNGTICVDHLSGSQFTGQIVRDDEKILYASLIPDKHAKFNTAAEFSI